MRKLCIGLLLAVLISPQLLLCQTIVVPIVETPVQLGYQEAFEATVKVPPEGGPVESVAIRWAGFTQHGVLGCPHWSDIALIPRLSCWIKSPSGDSHYWTWIADQQGSFESIDPLLYLDVPPFGDEPNLNFLLGGPVSIRLAVYWSPPPDDHYFRRIGCAVTEPAQVEVSSAELVVVMSDPTAVTSSTWSRIKGLYR